MVHYIECHVEARRMDSSEKDFGPHTRRVNPEFGHFDKNQLNLRIVVHSPPDAISPSP